jgi:hypothetical protein
MEPKGVWKSKVYNYAITFGHVAYIISIVGNIFREILLLFYVRIVVSVCRMEFVYIRYVHATLFIKKYVHITKNYCTRALRHDEAHFEKLQLL